MGELMIVSREPSEGHPEGRHYVVNTADAYLDKGILFMNSVILAISSTYDEAAIILKNIK